MLPPSSRYKQKYREIAECSRCPWMQWCFCYSFRPPLATRFLVPPLTWQTSRTTSKTSSKHPSWFQGDPEVPSSLCISHLKWFPFSCFLHFYHDYRGHQTFSLNIKMINVLGYVSYTHPLLHVLCLVLLNFIFTSNILKLRNHC